MGGKCDSQGGSLVCAVWRDHCAALDKSRAAAEVSQLGREGGSGQERVAGRGKAVVMQSSSSLFMQPTYYLTKIRMYST